MRQRSSTLGSLGMVGALLLGLAGCGSPGPEGVYKVGGPYQIAGHWYHPEFDPDYDREGIASWYGPGFHGGSTANGETFDADELTAAHPTLPLPSIVRVTNLANRRQLDVRVNDRGPFVGDRIIDVSQAAARQLGFERRGTARVRVEFLRLADANGAPPQPTPHQTQPGASTAPNTGPAAAPTAASTILAAAPANRCDGSFIQVGAFAESERAMREAARLYRLTVVPVSTQTLADRLMRLRLGPIPDVRSAEATLDHLKQSGYTGAFIVEPGASAPTSC
jgi:rare lipoprotein A